MNPLGEMQQIIGPTKTRTICMPPMGLDGSTTLISSIRRQASMNNLKSAGERGRSRDADFDDHGDVVEGKGFASDPEGIDKSPMAAAKSTSTRNTKDWKRDINANPLAKDHRELQRTHNKLIDELRAANRDLREQSLEMRTIKRQNMQIREAYSKLYNETMEDPQQLSRREKIKYHEHFDLMQQDLALLQNELEKRDSHIEMLTKQTREANKERDELDGTNRRLQRHNQELSANLTECKDDLLRLQPTSQTSDSEIAERYSNLCQQIAGWVDDQTENIEMLEERFKGLNSTDELACDPDLAQFATPANLKLAWGHPDSVPWILQYLIHCYLGQYVFGENVYCYGLDAHNAALIRQIEQGIGLLEPRRDAVTLRQWRSEALHGLLKVDGFAAARQRHGVALANSIYSALARMVSGDAAIVPQEGWKELHKQVVSPAIELATAIHVSTAEYHFARHLSSKPLERQETVYRDEIQHYQLVDDATHRIIRPDSALKIGEDGRIGTELFVISPGLLRHKEGDQKAIISRPTVLVKLDQPMEKRGRSMKGFGSFVSNFLGGESSSIGG